MTQIQLIKKLERAMGVAFDHEGTYETDGFSIGLSGDLYDGDDTYLGIITPKLAAFIPIDTIGYVELSEYHLDILSRTSGYLALVPRSLYEEVTE